MYFWRKKKKKPVYFFVIISDKPALCLICCQAIIWTTGNHLTHWGRVTHICVSKLTIIGSDNGLSPGRCQAIIRTNAWILFRTLGINFSEILSEIHTFSFKKMHLKISSGKCWPFCLGLNVLHASLGHKAPYNPHCDNLITGCLSHWQPWMHQVKIRLSHWQLFHFSDSFLWQKISLFWFNLKWISWS